MRTGVSFFLPCVFNRFISVETVEIFQMDTPTDNRQNDVPTGYFITPQEWEKMYGHNDTTRAIIGKDIPLVHKTNFVQLVKDATIVAHACVISDLDRHTDEFRKKNLTTGLHFFQNIKKEINLSSQNITSIVQRLSQNPFFIEHHNQYSIAKMGQRQTVDYAYKADDKRARKIEDDMIKIQGSEEKARSMVGKALSSLDLQNQQSAKYIAHGIHQCINVFDIQMASILNKIEVNRELAISQIINFNQENVKLSKSVLLDKTLWNQAGYQLTKSNYSDNVEAMSVIKLIPLRMYRLLNDTKRNLLVASGSSDEMRTRVHIGVPGISYITGILNPDMLQENLEIDPNIFFYYNLISLSQLANTIHKISAKVRALETMTAINSHINSSIMSIRKQIELSSNFESVSALATKVVAMETEASTKNIVLVSSKIKHALRVQLTTSELHKQIERIDQEAQSYSHINEVRAQMSSERERYWQQSNDDISLIIERIRAIHSLSLLGNSTARKIKISTETANADLMSERAKIFADAIEERNQEAFTLDQIQILGEEAKVTILQLIEVIVSHIYDGIKDISSRDSQYKIFMLIIGATSLAFSISVAKEFIRLVFSMLHQSLSMPRLVRHWGGKQTIWNKNIASLDVSTAMLSPSDECRIRDLCAAIKTGRRRGSPLRNILLHGPPGCGKSLVANAIANSANDLPFAVMSGADISPLGHLGPSELRKVLTWATGRIQGGIVIIDEADSALGRRIRGTNNGNRTLQADTSISKSTFAAARDALNVFLSMTGDTGGKSMIILTTCNPDALDEAVLDRCDEIIYLGLPSLEQRMKILKQKLYKHFNTSDMLHDKPDCNVESATNKFFSSRRLLQSGTTFDKSKNLEKTSRMTDGLSGRELSKIMRAVENAVYSSDDCLLTNKIWNKVTEDMCVSMKAKRRLKLAK